MKLIRSSASSLEDLVRSGTNARTSSALINVVVSLALLVGVSETAAQGPSLGVWSGYSFDSGGPFSPLQSFDLLLIGARYERGIVGTNVAEVTYTLDIIPVAIIPNNIHSNAQYDPARGWVVRRNARRGLTWGAGAMPLGLRLTAAPEEIVRPFASAAAGAVYFASPMPAANGRRFNFSAEVGAGVHVAMGVQWGIEVGLKLHHLSNAGTGDVNPGLDSKVIYVGLTTSN